MENAYLNKMFSLQGRTAVIAGGTGGIGSAIVMALLGAGVSSIISLELPNDPLSSALLKR